MNFRLAVALLLASILVVFAVQNYQVVELRFLFWKLEMSRAIMLIGVFIVGSVVGALAANVRRIAGGSE